MSGGTGAASGAAWDEPPAVTHGMSQAQAARWYLARGLRPIPWEATPEGRKKVAVAGFTYEEYVTAPPEKVAALLALWDERPGWQAGLALSRHAAVPVFAVDVDAYAELAAWEADPEHGGLGPLCGGDGGTWRSLTGRDGGGEQRLFVASEAFRRGLGDVTGDGFGLWPAQGAFDRARYPHLEIKSNGFVAVPPSTHPSGRPYRWAEDAPPGIGEPDWQLTAYLAARETRRAGGGGSGAGGGSTRGDGPGWAGGAGTGANGERLDVDALIANGAGATDQDHTLSRLVFALVARGRSDEEVAAAWLAVVARTPLARPHEPWTDADLARHLRGARGKLGGAERVRAELAARAPAPAQVAWAAGLANGATATATASAAPAEPAGPDAPPSPQVPAEAAPTLAAGPEIVDGDEPEDDTDLGNATRLRRLAGADLRHVAGVGWHTYENEGVWRADETARATWLTSRVAADVRALRNHLLETDAPEPVARRWDAHHRRTASAAGARAMLELAAAHPDLALTTRALDPDPWLLRAPNGTVELRSQALRASRRGDLHTREAGVAFPTHGVDRACPGFERFAAGALPDPEVRAYVQRVCGYLLTGDVSEQAFWYLHGERGAGKSTLAEVMRLVLGGYAHVADDELLYNAGAHSTNVVDLLGKRLVIKDELSRTRRLDTARLNAIASGGVLTGRRMRQDQVVIPITAKLLLTSNDPAPMGGSAKDGVWRRAKTVAFARAVPAGSVVRDYARLLVADEGPGILWWCLAGLRGYLELGGLGEPGSVTRDVDAYRESEKSSAELFTDLRLTDDDREDAWLASSDVAREYQRWCRDEGHRPEDPRMLGRAIGAAGFRPSRKLQARRALPGGGEERTRVNGWLGVRLDVERSGAEWLGLGEPGAWEPVGTPRER